MNRKELIDALAAKTGSSKADADRSIAALLDIVTTTLKKGDNVALVGFGGRASPTPDRKGAGTLEEAATKEWD